MLELGKRNLSLLKVWLLKIVESEIKTGNYFGQLDKILDRVIEKSSIGIKVE
jgi:hypothetical protein